MGRRLRTSRRVCGATESPSRGVLRGAGSGRARRAPLDEARVAAILSVAMAVARLRTVTRLLGLTGLALAGCRSSGGVHGAHNVGGGGGAAGVGTIGGCQVFPADNPWNQDVSGLAVNPANATYLASMNPTKALHADWGDYAQNGDYFGIPFSSGTGAPPQVMTFDDAGASDMDACPSGGGSYCYPIPLNAPIEGGAGAASDADRHVLYVDTAGGPANCTLYELYDAKNPSGGSGWAAVNGAIFHLGSDALRPANWTSADAAGLPILAGLVRYDETINVKRITHAIRFTAGHTQQAFIHPATHAAGSANASYPPMGLRLRLKASFDLGGFSGPALVILTAMKTYGLILADNGSDWYVTGESNDLWDSYVDDINAGLKKVTGNDFEAVDTGALIQAD
jgi:hypothetical protein